MAGSDRSLHLISGNMAWSHQQVAHLIDDFAHQRLLVLSNNIDGLAVKDYKQILGQEYDAVIYDCFSGLDADALGAVSGTIRGGGALILATPPLDEWSQFNDPDYRRHGFPQDQQPEGLFIQRLVRLLLRSDHHFTHSRLNTDRVHIELQPAHITTSSSDQSLAIEAIQRVALGHAKRPLVIRADRGRGKSAAIGIAAANLLENGKRTILVTAPAFNAVETLFRHAANKLPAFTRQGQRLFHADGRMLAYIAPDRLIHDNPDCDLLCVDEAAAIPAQLLEHMLSHYNRLLFSTTVHGYEGSGRGFDIRFSKVLDRLAPQWKHVRLESPIRWKSEDQLETILNELLLLNSDRQRSSSAAALSSDDLVITAVSQQMLFNNEQLLADFFGLLVTAHYRTRPFDLRHLLDATQLRMWSASINNEVVGALVCATEGAIESKLAEAIREGQRRPANQLIPQALQQHLGLDDALETRFLRIMRIAVTPGLQRHGIGKQLLERAMQDSCGEGKNSADLLATSFGATAGLLDFWQAAAFTPVRIGLTRDAASGCHSAVMLSPTNEDGKQLLHRAQQRFAAILPYLLNNALRGLETDIVKRLLPTTPLTIDQESMHRLTRFSSGALALDALLPDLELITRVLIARALDDALEPDELACLILFSLQGCDSQEVATRVGMQGKAAASSMLRNAVHNGLALLS